MMDYILDHWIMSLIFVVCVIGVIIYLVAWFDYNHQVLSGIIINKRFIPAHDSTYTTFITVGKINIPQFHTQHHPDAWEITLDGRDRREKRRQYTWNVSKKFYDKYKIGDKCIIEQTNE